MRLRWLASATLVTGLVTAASASAENWPQFRGPRGQGLSADSDVPLTWTATANVLWKTPLPGPGHSSPIVWGDRIFLTAFKETPGGSWPITRSINRRLRLGIRVTGHLLVICVDRVTGRLVWEREVEADEIEEVAVGNSPASPTPVTDGVLVYVHFGSFGLVAFDFAGNKVWERRLGPFENEHGSASSPILHGNALVLNSDTEGEDFLLAVDSRTGRVIWQTKRDTWRAWPTPFVWSTAEGDQIVVSGHSRVTGYDAATGREQWNAESLSGPVAPSPVSAHGLLYVATNTDGRHLVMAIRAGGRGDITSTHVAWRLDRAAPFMSSPIVVGNYLFTVRSGGVMACIDARTGQLAWQERLPGAPGDYYASPVAIDGRLYVMNEEGQVSVVTATPRFEWLGSSDMAQRTLASPAVSQGALFIRTDTHLWAIGRRGR